MRITIFGSLAAILLQAAAASAGVILSPTIVVSNSAGEENASLSINNTINGSGLSTPFTSGVTDFDSYLAGNPLHSVLGNGEWVQAAVPSGSPPPTATIIYDLGAEYTITRLALWNEEALGIGTMAVSTSNDVTFALSTAVGNFNPIQNPVGMTIFTYPAEVFGLTSTNARYVRLQVTGGGRNFSGHFIAMGEIAFDVRPVPEPSSIALLSMGAVGMLGLARRRRSA